ncbi:MAG: TolC family protein [Deltaproteobacteria bacterium]|nr:TolC family protein [Deltaproteobacteria bacterium]
MKQKNVIKKICGQILCLILISLLFCGNLYAQDKKQKKFPPSRPDIKNKNQTCAACGDEEKILLKDAITIALGQPQIKVAQSAFKAANFDITAAKSKRLPSVDIYSDAGYQAADNFYTRNNAGLSYNSEQRVSDIRNGFQIKLTQPLFDGYNAKYNINAQSNNAKALKYELIHLKEQTAFNAARAYISLIFVNKAYTLATRNILKYREILDRVKKLYKAGKIEESYFFEMLELYDSISDKKASISSECRKADVEYKFAVGMLSPTSSSLLKEPKEPSLCPDTKMKVYNLLIANNPLLLACKAYEKAAVEKAKAANASFMPNINLELAKTWLKNVDGSETNEDNEFALITLNYNLFNGGADTALKKKAKELKKKARYQKERLISIIEKKANRFFVDILASLRNIKTLTILQEIQIKLIRSYQKKDTYIDMMKAEDRLLETNLALLTAKENYLITQYEILAEGGVLLKSFNLN